MDKKALIISIALGLFIFLAMGFYCIVFSTALLPFLYGTDSCDLSRAFEETMFMIENSNKILPSFALGFVCTAIVNLLGESIAIGLFRNNRMTREVSIVLSGIAWVLCGVVGWFSPYISYAIEMWKEL